MEKSDPLRQLLLAAVLLTRLPLPRLPDSAFAQGARAVWAYPVVGAGIGIIGAGAGLLGLWLGLPALAAAIVTLAAMILVTGAMHEDGLADVFDGFWGGFAPEQRLGIMRDSQIGTYGVLALIIVFSLRLSTVPFLLAAHPAALIAAASLSRGMMPALMAGLAAARRDGLSQSVGRPSAFLAACACLLGAATALVCLGGAGLFALVAAAGVTVGMAALAYKKIGGQTGDVLGATQQLAETAVLLVCAAMLGT